MRQNRDCIMSKIVVEELGSGARGVQIIMVHREAECFIRAIEAACCSVKKTMDIFILSTAITGMTTPSTILNSRYQVKMRMITACLHGMSRQIFLWKDLSPE